MLDLVEHLASGVQGVALLIVCLARADLLDERPTWSGGQVRASAIELQALPPDDSEQLVDALGREEPFVLTAEQRAAVLETTEGNPLFIEETVRMLLESDNPRAGIPPTVQAMIAARIDRLPAVRRPSSAAQRSPDGRSGRVR